MKKKLILLITILVIAMLLSGCTDKSNTDTSDDKKDDTKDEQKDKTKYEGTLYEYNSKSLDSHFAFMHPEHFKEMIDLGVSWHRPHAGPFNWGEIEKASGNFDWEEADYEVNSSQYYAMNILATIWPFADWDQSQCNEKLSSSQSKMFSELGSYRGKPCDMNAYKNFVTKLVERYDGDGIDDMPDLIVPIKYWEVSNEPSMQDENLMFFAGKSSDYYDILKATYEAIKEADASAYVLSGGMAGVAKDNKDFWQGVFDLGGQNYFDIGNIHSIGSDSASLYGEDYKEFLDENEINKTFWTTEAEITSRSLDEDASEEAFAEIIVKSYVEAFESGSDKIFYVGLEEAPGDEEAWLIGKSDQKQEAYYAYKTMVEKVDYFDTVEKLAEGQFKFTIDSNIVYVLWSENDIPAEITGQVKVTDIKGAETTIQSTELSLDDSPVFVEIV